MVICLRMPLSSITKSPLRDHKTHVDYTHVAPTPFLFKGSQNSRMNRTVTCVALRIAKNNHNTLPMHPINTETYIYCFVFYLVFKQLAVTSAALTCRQFLRPLSAHRNHVRWTESDRPAEGCSWSPDLPAFSGC